MRSNETMAHGVFVDISSRYRAVRINGFWSEKIASSYLRRDAAWYIEGRNRAIPGSNSI